MSGDQGDIFGAYPDDEDAERLRLDALGPPVARHTDPATSHIAARLTEPRAGTNRALALRVLREHPGGLTDYELAALTGIQQNSIGKRRGELRDGGFVRNTGQMRAAPSGSPAYVWEAVPPEELAPVREPRRPLPDELNALAARVVAYDAALKEAEQ